MSGTGGPWEAAVDRWSVPCPAGPVGRRTRAPEGQCAGPGTLGPPWLAAGVGEGLPGDGLSLEQRPKGH